MSGPATAGREPLASREPPVLRRAALLVSVLLLLVAVLPPLATGARRYDFAEAIQFSLLAIAVPALGAVGDRWARSTRAGALAAARLRHPETVRSLAFLALWVCAVVAWRTPPAVDALGRHGWLVAVEAVTLVSTGLGLWLELVESPPLTPRSTRPVRVLLAALAMWAVWIAAYAMGLSRAEVYRGFQHLPGGLSVGADQAVATATLWFAALCAFVPVVFFNLLRWLHTEEQPDEELRKLLREEGRRGVPHPRPGRRPRGS